MKPLVPRTLVELEAALGPELDEIVQRHRAELTHREPYQPVVFVPQVVTPPVFCIRPTGRTRRPGSRRTHCKAGASSSDDDGGGESDPEGLAASAVAVPSSSPTSSIPIEHNTGRPPVCGQENAR